MELLKQTIKKIEDLDTTAMKKAKDRVEYLLKPQGSLGKLESIAIQLAGITGNICPTVENKAIIVMSADHGVCVHGIAATPISVTHMMTSKIADGVSGVGALASQANSDIIVVDIGVADEVNHPKVIKRKIKKGTNDMTKEPAMTREEAIKSLEVGIEVANDKIKNGYNLIGTGEMGIGNTTASTAILSVITSISPDEITGVGANLPIEQLDNKKAVIKKAITLNKPNKEDAIDILSKVGGLEIGGMAGVMLACAANRVPVVIDGYISTVSAMLAALIEPKAKQYMICSHASHEKGAKTASEWLGFQPFLNLDMRLGEGSGAAIAFNIVEASTYMMRQMITFEEAGIGVV